MNTTNLNHKMPTKKLKTHNHFNKNKMFNLNYGLLNARSVNNKTDSVVEFIVEHQLHILCITETWLQSNDNFTINSITPSGFDVISNPRLNKRGGGVAVIIKNDLIYKKLSNICFITFEVLMLQVTSSSKSFAIVTIYRSPGPLGNFITELSDFLSTLVSKYDDFVLAGDFNIHLDIETDESSKKLAIVLKSFDLKQHVNLPTHAGGHILDLLISKENTDLVKAVAVTQGISDHHGILADLGIAMKRRVVIKKSFHQFKKLDMVKFQCDVRSSDLYLNPSPDVDIFATQYNNIVSKLVSSHAPIVTRTVTSRPPAPWYTPEIALARKKRRQLERHWRHTKLTVDHEIYVAQKNLVNSMLASAKAKHYVSLVKNNSGNPKQLWSTIQTLSGNTKSRILPDHDNMATLVNDFNCYFIDKVAQIRDNINMLTSAINTNPDGSNSTCIIQLRHEIPRISI